jgi:hypothetical protein
MERRSFVRRRLATLIAVAVAALTLAAPSLGDGGWGSGGNDPTCPEAGATC